MFLPKHKKRGPPGWAVLLSEADLYSNFAQSFGPEASHGAVGGVERPGYPGQVSPVQLLQDAALLFRRQATGLYNDCGPLLWQDAQRLPQRP